jgi:multiple sugar transport system permease protein
LLAGLQSIPRELYDASEVDGAGMFSKFRYITYPLLTPFVNIGLLFCGLGAMGSLDIVYIMTNGGPGTSTNIFPLFLYKTYFMAWDFGLGGAASVFLMIFTMITFFFLVRSLIKYVVRM